MRKAGYSQEQQVKYCSIVQESIVPFISPGPKPNSLPPFGSFCNDDFSPVELSWNFYAGKSTVQISFEPIGRFAGTSKDPFNVLEPARVMSHLLTRDPTPMTSYGVASPKPLPSRRNKHLKSCLVRHQMST